MAVDLVRARLAVHRLVPPFAPDAAAVVRGLLAVQAQDYGAGLWAIAQRTVAPSRAAVEAALADRTLVRTWPMRGTLHVVAAEDVRWLVALLAPRVLGRVAARFRQLGLDARVLAKARKWIERALADGATRTRAELFAILARAKIDPRDQRGIHVLFALAHAGVLCYAAHRGAQPTFALLDDWIPRTRARDLAGDAALGELARRYFAGHGPARLEDFRWWTGLTVTEARRALAIAGAALEARTIAGVTYYGSGPRARAKAGTAHLLSGWDEYTVGYRDRTAFLDPAHHARSLGALAPVVIVDGRVAGLWKRAATRARVRVTVELFAPVTAAARRALAGAAARYGAFLGVPAELAFAEAVRARRR